MRIFWKLSHTLYKCGFVIENHGKNQPIHHLFLVACQYASVYPSVTHDSHNLLFVRCIHGDAHLGEEFIRHEIQ